MNPTITRVPLHLLIDCGVTTGSGWVDPITGSVWTNDIYYDDNLDNYVRTDNPCQFPQQAIYCTQRTGYAIEYKIPVPVVGYYNVTLYFIEFAFVKAGRRVMNITVEDNITIKQYDIAKQFGSKKPGYLLVGITYVRDGYLSIRLVSDPSTPTYERSSISGIEVIEIPPQVVSAPQPNPQVPVLPPALAPTTAIISPTVPSPVTMSPTKARVPLVLRMNCGIEEGPIYVDPSTGLTWSNDMYFTKITGTFAKIETNCLTPLQAIYCSSRVGYTIQYDIPVFPGYYNVTLYFIELFWVKAGKRSMDISIENGAISFNNYDVWAKQGYRKPGSLFVGTIYVTDGFLSIQLVTDPSTPTQRCALNGIEVIEIPQKVPTLPPQLPPVTPPHIQKRDNTRVPIMIPTTVVLPPPVLPIASIRNPTANPIMINPTIRPITVSPMTNPPTLPSAILPLRMNIGAGNGMTYKDASEQEWVSESYFVDTAGNSVTKSFTTKMIKNTLDDIIYQYLREGSNFGYHIPLQIGNYEINLHFVECEFLDVNQRVFNVQVETTIVTGVDIIKGVSAGANSRFTPYVLQFAETVDDGILNIQLSQVGSFGVPTIAGIEVIAIAPHYAHAVSDGPYAAVDHNGIGRATVRVDASNSHTHGINMELVSSTWTEADTVIANGLITDITLPVGIHNVTLTVTDSSGSKSSDTTTITINPVGFPEIEMIAPDQGRLSGGDKVTITGSGFGANLDDVAVRFGTVLLQGHKSIQLINDRTIIVISPPSVVGTQVPISVKTSRGESSVRTPDGGSIQYTYVGSSPITFNGGVLFVMPKVTVVRFGPDRLLYVGTANGKVGKYQIDLDQMKVMGAVVSQILPSDRNILGIAFDPMENDATLPKMYISHSFFFHKDPTSSSGLSINGKISRVSGPNLDQIEDIITGLPVSDHDHGINAIEFGNNGELYLAVGSNTNGGKPGAMSQTLLQKENYFSAAILVAYLQDPDFSGTIRYSKDDDGDPIATGIEVFAHGVRNPYGMILHSNGYLYATDNGPNTSYGNMLTGCGPKDFIPDKTDKDKLLLIIEKGAYHGHPNPKRAAFLKEPRQCVWHPTADAGTSDYTAPIAVLESSSDGIIDYHANYFDGQLRDNLIISKYGDGLTRVILTPDGTATIPESFYGLNLVGDKGLDVTLAPDGSIIEARYTSASVYYQKPLEEPTTALKLFAVFPHRGRSSGGNKLSIYGINFDASTIPSIGGSPCLDVKFVSTKLIECTLPGGIPGPVDVAVRKGSEASTFTNGYRYITGLPQK